MGLCLTALLVLAPGAAAGAPLDASIWAELGRPTTLAASFSQVQHRAILKVPLVSEGHLSFDRAHTHLIWQVDSPARSTFSLEGSTARLEQPDLDLSESFDLAAVPDANRIATSMMVWLSADPGQVERDFGVQYGEHTVALTPKDSMLASLIKTITLTVVPGPWRVSTVEMREPDDDQILLQFHQLVLDGHPVPDP